MKRIVRLKSCAKINLGLSVLSKKNDGFHIVDMAMQSVDLCDYITLKKNDVSETRIFCDKELDCKVKDNIAYKTVRKFLNYIGKNNFFVDVDIKKNIPICAGLAGGSSNAAAVLLGLNDMMETNLSLSELAQIGKDIGSDVPFCIFGGTMRATGTGTDLEKIGNHLKYYILLVKPKISISTKDAYEKIDLYNNFNEKKKICDILYCVIKNDIIGLSENLFNDLENSLSEEQKKEIDYIKKYLISMGALNSCMSGSGPCVYGIFDNDFTAKNCFEKIKTQYFESFLCRPVNYGVKIL